MDKHESNVADMYKKYYDKYEKESICLNMKKYESKGCFHFLLKGCACVLDKDKYDLFFRDYGSLAFPGYWPKTNDCKIIINCRYTYSCFRIVIKTLEKEIHEWEKLYFKMVFDNLLLEREIEKKAIIDVLKKEISFIKNRLMFQEWWFLKGFKI